MQFNWGTHPGWWQGSTLERVYQEVQDLLLIPSESMRRKSPPNHLL